MEQDLLKIHEYSLSDDLTKNERGILGEIVMKVDMGALISLTFFVRVAGYSMINAGIHENDILIVDRSVKPELGKVVVAAVNGELTVKRLAKNKQGVCHG